MNKTKKSRPPIGAKKVGTNEEIAEVLRQLEDVKWMKNFPQHPNYPTFPFPYGTNESIFK